MGTTLLTAPIHPITDNIPPMKTRQRHKTTDENRILVSVQNSAHNSPNMIGQNQYPLIQISNSCVKRARLYIRIKLGFLGMYHRFCI